MSGPLRKSLGSLAAVAALSTPAVAPATIQVSALSNINLPDSGSYNIDVDGDSLTDFSIDAANENISGSFINGAGYNSISATLSGPIPAIVYNSNETVDAGLTYNDSADMGGFINSGTSYLAFSFFVGGSTRYGWMEFTLPFGSDLTDGTLNAIAWEDSGASIQTGAVPEPAHAAIGGGIIAGLLAFFRRRRQRKQTA